MTVPFVHVAPNALDGQGTGDVVELDAATERHLREVRRHRAGTLVELCDGQGLTASGELVDRGVRLRTSPTRHPAPTHRLEVIHALPKGRKFDEVVRVLTELGVDRIRPVESSHSVVRFDEARGARALRRWQGVARAAAQQSRRVWLPTIDPPVRLVADGIEMAGGAGLVAHVGAPTGLVVWLRGARPVDGPMAVAVGPEGGWAADELDLFAAAGYQAVHLGATVLRTEHAAAAMVAVVAAAMGRMD